MTVILRRNDEDTALEPVSETNPLHVALPDGAVVTSHVYRSETIEIPGIGAAVAYASGDAFGTKFSINVPNEGTIATLVFIDRDDEGITKEFILFDAEFSPTADNSAFTVSDTDMARCIGNIIVDSADFTNFAANQICVASPALAYKVTNGRIWCQVVTRGADNIAAGSSPQFFVVIV